MAGRRTGRKADEKLARADRVWSGSWKGRNFWTGGWSGRAGRQKFGPGGEKLEGALERERGGDKISRSGRELDGGIFAGQGMDGKQGFSPHPGSDPIISVQC